MAPFQSVHALGQQPAELGQVAEPVRQQAQPLSFDGPWLTATEAAAYIRCKSVDAFYQWRKRHGIVAYNKGRHLLIAKADLDRAIGAKALRRRRSTVR